MYFKLKEKEKFSKHGVRLLIDWGESAKLILEKLSSFFKNKVSIKCRIINSKKDEKDVIIFNGVSISIFLLHELIFVDWMVTTYKIKIQMLTSSPKRNNPRQLNFDPNKSNWNKKLPSKL